MVERHHLMPRMAGGDEEPANLVYLCPNHHKLTTLLYNDAWGIELAYIMTREGLIHILREMDRRAEVGEPFHWEEIACLKVN